MQCLLYIFHDNDLTSFCTFGDRSLFSNLYFSVMLYGKTIPLCALWYLKSLIQ